MWPLGLLFVDLIPFSYKVRLIFRRPIRPMGLFLTKPPWLLEISNLIHLNK
jgi:hypothetical protein